MYVCTRVHLHAYRHVYVWTFHGAPTHIYIQTYVYICVQIHSYIHTYMYMWIYSTMGWLRLVGSLNYRSLLQKSQTKETISIIPDTSRPLTNAWRLYIKMHYIQMYDMNIYIQGSMCSMQDSCVEGAMISRAHLRKEPWFTGLICRKSHD